MEARLPRGRSGPGTVRRPGGTDAGRGRTGPLRGLADGRRRPRPLRLDHRDGADAGPVPGLPDDQDSGLHGRTCRGRSREGSRLMDAVVSKRSDQELGGAPEGLDALTVAERLKAEGGVGLFVARDYARMGEFVQAFRFFADEVEVVEFPAWDCLPYDRLSPTSAVSAERMAALTRLACREVGDSRPLLVVTTVGAAIQRTPPREVTCGAGFETTVGLDLDSTALEKYFGANGYMRASTVSERGEFAVRGGVIDVFPPGFDEPVRLDMFGAELESIRTFDPATQRSTGQKRSVSLAPV